MHTTTTLSDLTPTTASPRGLRRSLHSAGAVLGGLLATFAVTSAVDAVFHALGVFPPFGEPMSDALFALALAYRIPLNAAGCYLTARLAPGNPARHAFVLGGVGFVLAIAGAVAMWDLGPGWYSLANVAIALPCAWLAVRVHAAGERRRGG